MKTLKKDGINEKLLIQTLAFIETHPADWNQGAWRCQTGMCFAGHAAVIGGAKFIAPVTRDLEKLIKKQDAGETLTADERDALSDYYTNDNYVQADPSLDDEPQTIEYRGRHRKAVTIADRAMTLLGRDAVMGRTRSLFTGSNKLPHIRRHIASKLDISLEELNKRTARVAKRNGWTKP